MSLFNQSVNRPVGCDQEDQSLSHTDIGNGINKQYCGGVSQESQQSQNDTHTERLIISIEESSKSKANKDIKETRDGNQNNSISNVKIKRPRGRPRKHPVVATKQADTGHGSVNHTGNGGINHTGHGSVNHTGHGGITHTGHGDVNHSGTSWSVKSVDNSLGETLATSLNLIATNSSYPPPPSSLLEQSFTGDLLNFTSGSQESNPKQNHDHLPSSTDAPTCQDTRSPMKKNRKKRGPQKKIHKRMNNEDKVYSDSEMMKPILHDDGSVTLFQCEVCEKLFNKRQTLRQHFITHTDRFACQFCDARCKSKGDLRTHIQTHTKERPYHCDICNTDYTRESILRKHLKTQLHLRAIYERDNNEQIQMYSQNRSLRVIDHFIPSKAKVKLEGFSCSVCSKVFLTKVKYRKHIKSHSMTYVCNVCHKGCKTALLLKIHSRSHTAESELDCKRCFRKFSSVQQLKAHLKTHNRLAGAKEAGESLIKAVINKHNKDIKMLKVSSDSQDNEPKKETIVGAHGSKKASHECSICHRMFTSEKRLANHCHTHKGLFSCTVCTKSFPTVAKLSNHMVDHEKQDAKCEICHASYGDPDELKGHLEKVHSEGSDLVCKICYKRFDAAIDVYRHMNDHAPTMLFSGGCLDESSIPVVTRGKRATNHANFKVSDSDDSSDEDRKPPQGTIGKNQAEVITQRRANEESDCDNQLTNSEFIEVVNTALMLEDDPNDAIGQEELSEEFEDKLLACVAEVLESEILSSAESDDLDDEPQDDDADSMIEKPILYCHGDIVRKHSEEFELHSHKDVEKNIYQCTLCDISYEKEKYLNDHLKCHVCEYCNKFFTDRGKLSLHKSSHVKRLISKIDTETKRIHQPRGRQRWKYYQMVSSESEVDNEERFLTELEDILDNDSNKNSRVANFLKTLSHDDIIKVNKPMFDEHSFVDIANNIFACTICKRKYARPTTLTRHFKTHVCQYCNTFFTDKSDLLEHKYRHRKRAALMKAEITGEGGKMPPSPVVSKENRALFKRYSFVDSSRNINRCTLCSKDFVRRTVLTRHLKTHICSHCDKFFEDKYDLVKHATYHKVENQRLDDEGDDEGEDFIDYDEDTKEFSHSSSMTASMDDKSLDIPSTFSSSLAPYSSYHGQSPCTSRNEPMTYITLPSRGNDEAGSAQVFSNQSTNPPSFQIISQSVNMYKETGSDSFLVSTPNCPSNDEDKIITISQPPLLHADPGQRERLFECGECGKRFFKNGHLKSHMTIHTGSRPYVCSVCGKAFSRGTTLRKHEKTHLKRCKICDTTFASKYELDLHLEIHRTYAFYK